MYSVLSVIVDHLREQKILLGATITEDFVSPVTHRPVLTPVVSVGVKTMEMLPTSRYSHNINTVVKLTMLFPCGVGEDPKVSETVYAVAASMIGQSFLSMVVKGIEVSKTSFDANMYGIHVEMDLLMEGNLNRKDPANTKEEEHFSIEMLAFDRMPEKIRVTKATSADTAIEDAPRLFTLEGSSTETPGGELWDGLHALFSAGSPVGLTLPRTEAAIRVLPDSMATETDLCGYGFTYTLTFREVL